MKHQGRLLVLLLSLLGVVESFQGACRPLVSKVSLEKPLLLPPATSMCARPSCGTVRHASAIDTPSEDPSRVQLTKFYTSGQYLFTAMGMVLLFMPDRTMTTLLATKTGGAAGFLIAGGLSYILNGANKHDRLSSDTYKRLNVGLLGFFLFGLSAVPGEAAFLPTALPAILLSMVTSVMRVYGTIMAYLGWRQGVDLPSSPVLAPKAMLLELWQGTKATAKGLKVQQAKKALTYRNCLLLVCFGIFSSLMEGIFNIRYRETFNRTWFEISLQWSAMARLFMIATMIFSLKEAAERDRLTGTTFIQMNLMVGTWALLVALGQSVYPLGFAPYRGVEMFAFSLPFFIKAFKSQKEKEEEKRA